LALSATAFLQTESFTKELRAGDKITWQMEGSDSYDIEQRLLIEKGVVPLNRR
jgi:hypothetical protein